MTDSDPTSPPGTIAGHLARRRRTVTIRSLMIAVAWLAAWLALWRASPIAAVVVPVMAVPTLALQRFLLRDMGWDKPGGPGPLDRLLSFVVSALVVSACLPVLLALTAGLALLLVEALR